MSVERELTNGTPPTLSLTIVDSGRDAMLIWLDNRSVARRYVPSYPPPRADQTDRQTDSLSV